jgi:hypothetical protein
MARRIIEHLFYSVNPRPAVAGSRVVPPVARRLAVQRQISTRTEPPACLGASDRSCRSPGRPILAASRQATPILAASRQIDHRPRGDLLEICHPAANAHRPTDHLVEICHSAATPASHSAATPASHAAATPASHAASPDTIVIGPSRLVTRL